jgi:opacity protein-like surface antigen
MHKTLTATAILALLGAAGAANAADIYAPGYKDGPLVAYPTWTGYYIGGHVGGVWSTIDFTDVTSVPSVPFNNDTSGVFGGGQVGYVYQLGNVVIGPEVDIGGMGLSSSTREVGGLGAAGAVNSGFYFDITGRLGYAWGPALVYIKGGYAYYGGSLSVNDGLASASHSDLSGWTGGGGVEYMISPAWSVKAEYQFFEFNTFQLVNQLDGNTFDDRFTAQTFKVGFNYHFCAPYQPLK